MEKTKKPKLAICAALVLVLTSSMTLAHGQECRSMNPADWPSPARPYFMLVVDTSSSMISCTAGEQGWPASCSDTSPVNSCGMMPTRLNDAKCALRQTIQAFSGQVNFGMATYAAYLSDCETNPDGTCKTDCDAGLCASNKETYNCTLNWFDSDSPAAGLEGCGNWPKCAMGDSPGTPNWPADNWLNGANIVVPMARDSFGGATPTSNHQDLIKWFDGKCDDNIELFAGSRTPTAGAMMSVAQYMRGGWSMWPTDEYCADVTYTEGKSTFLSAADPSCRSVNVLFMTDGDPTNCIDTAYDRTFYPALQADGDPADAGVGLISDQGIAEHIASDLLENGVQVEGKTWKVKTYIINFAGGDSDKTDRIAQAGGTEASLLAQDEVSLAQSLSNIIAEAVPSEICDNQDNNCNGCVDEGYANYCNRNPGCCQDDRATCLANYEASISTSPPDGDLSLLPCVDPADLGNSDKWLCYNPKETCNYIDDNCDGQTDEGMLRCGSDDHCPSEEVCDGQDNDCNGQIDDGLGIGPTCANSPSGNPVGPCSAGVTVCIGGAPGCTGPSPHDEICDGMDNDCDGLTDEAEDLFGVGEACGNTLGLCTPGKYQCMCQGENPEECEIVCDGATKGVAEQCNGLDDDCDGEIDEDLVVGATCANTPTDEAEGVCGYGYEECIGGVWVCNANEPSEERCNGVDDDCDGQTDENLTVECPSFSLCVQGECEELCSGEEMGCPDGKTCEDVLAKDGKSTRVCVSNVCSDSSEDRLPCVDNPWWCDSGHPPPCRCNAALRACVGLCHGVTCPEGKTCIPQNGSCQLIGKDCYAAGCGTGQRCSAGECADNPCADEGTRCENSEYCNRAGECVSPCVDNDCEGGCYEGKCVENRCAGVFCQLGWSCNEETGECEKGGPCSTTTCRFFDICVDGECTEDPCWNIECKNGFRCQNGACYQYWENPTDTEVDSDQDTESPTDTDPGNSKNRLEQVLASGHGGCHCQAVPDTPSAHGTWFVALLLLTIGRTLKRRRLHLAILAACVIVAASFIVSCTTESYRFTAAGDDDTAAPKDTATTVDGGAPDTVCDSWAKDDDCDGIDNDCDGQTDEQVDHKNNPQHCGDCGNDCAKRYPNSLTRCDDGKCVMEKCAAFYQNLNGDLNDGCEYYCRQTSILDVCNGVDLGDGSYLGVDDDCDGETDEDVTLSSSLKNCGRCGNICEFDNAVSKCENGNCKLISCREGFWNVDLALKSGCEYACTKQSEKEICNNRDDNCDGSTDEELTIPTASDVCETAKLAETPECRSTSEGGLVNIECKNGSWSCTFPDAVCEPSCALTAEICDDKDNNCDGKLNENFEALGKPCASDDSAPDPGHGACRVTGVNVCDGANGLRCSATKASCKDFAGGCEEKCDNIDNDCDGLTDEHTDDKGAAADYFVKPSVTQCGENLWVFTYEASRASATATSSGFGNGYHCSAGTCTDGVAEQDTGISAPPLEKTIPCSAANRLPWFNVTPVEAEQSCQAIGGHLCTTEEWTTACQAGASCSYGYAPRGAACTSAAVSGSKYCNISNFDFNELTPEIQEDGLLPSGSSRLAQCYADWSGVYANGDENPNVFDLTGNLREITQKSANIYPLMGGGFNTESEAGSRCDFTFYTVEKQFRLFDTGFRCCFSTNPLE